MKKLQGMPKMQRKSNCLPVTKFAAPNGQRQDKLVSVPQQFEPTEKNPIRQHHKMAGA